MLVKKMHCPQGCQDSTFLESVKSVVGSNSNLLLDSSNQTQQQAMNIKVYTCNCCHKTFEIPQTSEKSIL